MTKRRSQSSKLDGVDAERIRNTVESSGWQLIHSRLRATVDAKALELERPLDQTETAYVRGFIAGLRLAMAIPGMLVKQAEENAKNGNPGDTEAG